MSSDSDVTLRTAESLRVNNLMPSLTPYLSERAKLVFKNVRIETSEELFHYGRVIRGEVKDADADFAHRLNKLFNTFDGSNDYYCYGKQIQPRITSCLSCPMSIPLIPEGRRKCRICKKDMIGPVCVGYGVEKHEVSAMYDVENPVPRVMYLAYVFVEGLDMTVLKNQEEARLWLNSITHSFIYAAREGELPTNPREM